MCCAYLLLEQNLTFAIIPLTYIVYLYIQFGAIYLNMSDYEDTRGLIIYIDCKINYFLLKLYFVKNILVPMRSTVNAKEKEAIKKLMFQR